MKTGDTIIHKQDPEKMGDITFIMGGHIDIAWIDPNTCEKTGEKDAVRREDYRVLVRSKRGNKVKEEV